MSHSSSAPESKAAGISTYQPQLVEAQARHFWEQHRCHESREIPERPKYYCLAMFPYPSGQLHMGHVRNYTIADLLARFQRMNGMNVLHPVGWDAFGLPAEKAAVQNHSSPDLWTRRNIDQMRNQLQQLGFMYDWSRELATCDASYYHWEQWFFLRLLKKGLVYRRQAEVNWDPVDQTVLANEQVIEGRGWRSGALVERRLMPQWFLKISAYSDQLLDDLEQLKAWPERVRTMQRNWIGRSEGVRLYFPLATPEAEEEERLEVFTTRPDTLMGATFVAIAPEHPLARSASRKDPKLADFIRRQTHTRTAEADLATRNKEGLATGHRVVHPLTGEELPVWVANFVLAGYGSGAIMCVPAHDQRDWEFARQYQLPIRPVIRPAEEEAPSIEAGAFSGAGILMQSGDFDGMDSAAGGKAIRMALEHKGLGSRAVRYRLRDWSISRQRYWGVPIPVIHCPECGPVPVPEDL